MISCFSPFLRREMQLSLQIDLGKERGEFSNTKLRGALDQFGPGRVTNLYPSPEVLAGLSPGLLARQENFRKPRCDLPRLGEGNELVYFFQKSAERLKLFDGDGL